MASAKRTAPSLAGWAQRLGVRVRELELRLEPDELPADLVLRRVLRVSDRPGYAVAPVDSEWVKLGGHVEPIGSRLRGDDSSSELAVPAAKPEPTQAAAKPKARHRGRGHGIQLDARARNRAAR